LKIQGSFPGRHRLADSPGKAGKELEQYDRGSMQQGCKDLVDPASRGYQYKVTCPQSFPVKQSAGFPEKT
jgi:hypothetical protein